MLCYVMLCYVMLWLCYVMLCYVMLCYVTNVCYDMLTKATRCGSHIHVRVCVCGTVQKNVSHLGHAVIRNFFVMTRRMSDINTEYQ